MAAQTGPFKRGNELLKLSKICGRCRTSANNAFKNFLDLTSTKPAWRALAAGFIRAEREYMMHEFWNGGVLVKRNDSSVANARTDGVQFLKAEWRIEQMRWNNASQRSADDDTFQRSVIAQASADFFDDLLHGHAEFDLVKTRPDEERVERHEFGPATVRKTERAIRLAAVADDPRDITSVSTLSINVGLPNKPCSVG